MSRFSRLRRLALIGLSGLVVFSSAALIAVPAAPGSITASPAGAATQPEWLEHAFDPNGHYLITAVPGHGPSLWAMMQYYLRTSIISMYGPDTADVYIPAETRAYFSPSWPTILSVKSLMPAAMSDRLPGPAMSWSAPGLPAKVASEIGAVDWWQRGYLGQGVDVAVIDSGVAPLPELTNGGRWINGPDLSFDASAASGTNADWDGIDAYGHGTHLAGIIAGKDVHLYLPKVGDSTSGKKYATGALSKFTGIAPGARIVNVRAGASDGAVDVSQIIAALDWVVANRKNPYVAPNLNIRVINLSFGTDGSQSWLSDPLAAAVENAWRNGIVVVVSAGNDGYSLGRLTNPAIDPYILAVGASDSMGTFTMIDDRIADYSSRGDNVRRPDIVAPGTSLVSLAVHGSAIDNTYPEGRVDNDFFRGSGTSQAAAVVTGAIAVLLSRYPGLPPDAIKAVIRASGHGIYGTGRNGNPLDQNMKRLDISAAGAAIDNWKRGSLPDQHTVTAPPSKGNGTLEAARGSNHVRYLDADGTPHELTGEFVATGDPWNWLAWRKSVTAGKPWFNPNDWTGHAWKDAAWQGHAWKSRGWTPTPWEGSTWEGHAWKGGGWESTS